MHIDLGDVGGAKKFGTGLTDMLTLSFSLNGSKVSLKLSQSEQSVLLTLTSERSISYKDGTDTTTYLRSIPLPELRANLDRE